MIRRRNYNLYESNNDSSYEKLYRRIVTVTERLDALSKVYADYVDCNDKFKRSLGDELSNLRSAINLLQYTLQDISNDD